MFNIYQCCSTIFTTLSLFTPFTLVCMTIIPFITVFLNVIVNSILYTENKNIIKYILFKMVLDYVSCVLQQRMYSSDINIMTNQLITRLNIAKIYCGVPIPGINIKQHNDLINDSSKLRDFLFLLPMFWSTLVNFSISIYMINIESIYPVRFLFSLLCILMCCIITYLNDSSLYQRIKPSSKTVTCFYNSEYTKLKLSMGCTLDKKFDNIQQKKRDNQRDLQMYIIIILNMITAYISISSNNLAQLHVFGNISWMISCLADNIKSLNYYTYMNEFISLCKCLESYKLKTGNEIINKIDSVTFTNTTFGYYADLTNISKIKKIITNFSYTFNSGFMYYIEAENGIGKSTIMRMFVCNLIKGNIFFGKTDRKNLTFTNIRKSVFHLVQASEFMPHFTKDEIVELKDKDVWLSEQLLLEHLFNKDTCEMSGGEKKRMLIYIALTSDAPIILLDEVFSELSTEETSDIPEGGGWLTRSIQTITMWKNRKKKIIIVVGHGLLELIPDNADIIKLQVKNTKNKTTLNNR